VSDLLGIPRRGMLVGIRPEEQARIGVPGDRPWLILQTEKCRDRDSMRTVLACYLTDVRKKDGQLKPERCGDVPVTRENGSEVSKDSFARLSEIHSVRESEIIKYRGKVSPIEMLLVDATLRDLLLDWEEQKSESKAEPSKSPGHERTRKQVPKR
jgi:mRNA-degrading endonuclease toxin of MazEF toxin-antitoxin module